MIQAQVVLETGGAADTLSFEEKATAREEANVEESAAGSLLPRS